MNSNDPTLQTSGSLLVSVRNETNFTYKDDGPSGKWRGMQVTPNPPDYLPPNSPPPAWVAGKDYFPYPGMAYHFGAILPTQYGQYAQGAWQALKVADMSAQAVKTGKGYFFTVDTPIGWGGRTVRVIWTITGVAGGSTLVAGFGLFNLLNNPNTWTYVTPPSFTGEFSIELNNPSFIDAVTLSVQYMPLRDFVTFKASCLNFRISGSLYSTATPQTADEQQPSAVQEILSASADYKVTNAPA
jgi:hypothetical protein